MEKYIKKGLATREKDGVGGYLYLTTSEIVFEGNKKNYNDVFLGLETIESIKLTGINFINIILKDGNEEKYRVMKRDNWKKLIETAVANNVKEFDESKDFFNNEDIKLYEKELTISHNLIKFKNIKDVTVNEDTLIIILNSNNQIKIKTTEAKKIFEFIKLQKDQNGTRVKTISFGEIYKKRLIFWTIVGIVITFLDRANNGFYNTGIFGVIGDMFFWGMIIGVPISLVSTFMHQDYKSFNRPIKVKCPYCHYEFKFANDFGEKPSSGTCINCEKKLFIKDHFVYKYTDEMEKYFLSFNQKKDKKHNNLDKYDELERLKELLDKDVITQEEFDKKKQELLK